MSRSVFFLLKKKKRLLEQEQTNDASKKRMATLYCSLESAKKQQRTQLAEIQNTKTIIEGHLTKALKHACFEQENALIQMMLAVHPLSKVSGLGRIMASFLSSDEIKALRNTCRAMTCFVHVHCKVTAVPKTVYVGKDRDGWKKWGTRLELTFEC
jgi:hypothetical protein